MREFIKNFVPRLSLIHFAVSHDKEFSIANLATYGFSFLLFAFSIQLLGSMAPIVITASIVGLVVVLGFFHGSDLRRIHDEFESCRRHYVHCLQAMYERDETKDA